MSRAALAGHALEGGETHMNIPVAAALLGLAVSLWFGIQAVRELKRDTPGHSFNAAMIHIAMVGLFVPFCVIILVAYWGK
jgi:hypothetical protein